MEFVDIVILAMIAEALWETLKMVWQNGKISIDRIGAILVGILIAVGCGIDVFEAIGLPMKIPFVGIVLTGLLFSRGANFIHDILSSISNVNISTKVQRQIKDSSAQK
jgi:hypothetical protein